MNFDFTPEQQRFQQEVIDLLQSSEFKKLQERIKKGPSEWDAREAYRLLGKYQLLAPNLPKELGGRGGSFIEVGILSEELTRNGVPEALYVLSVLIVGNLLYTSGTKEQHLKYLTEIASGSKYFIILYSEPKAGSDLSSLETTANINADGSYTLYGRKVYSMKTNQADYALCAARTSKRSSRYEGLTVFIVPLKQNGVHIHRIPSLSDEAMFEVILDGVSVGAADILGEKDEGWAIINQALALERTGLDYFIRAQKWFQLSLNLLQEKEMLSNESVQLEAARLKCKLDCSRYLTYRILGRLDKNFSVDEAIAAISKWYASELAHEVTWKFHSLLGVDMFSESPFSHYGGFEAAYREAPGLTLSAGTSEMMLESISKFCLNIKETPTGG